MNSSLHAQHLWRTDPDLAFATFLTQSEFQLLSRRKPQEKESNADHFPNPIRNSSIIVYRAMWAKYLRWLSAHRLNLFEVNSLLLREFLDQRDEKGRVERSSLIKLRYLRLFERVYAHLQVDVNPARSAMFDSWKKDMPSAMGQDDDKVVLTDEQQSAFMQALPAPENWKRRRDRAMQAIMLGAGLKVSEAINLRVNQIGEVETKEIPITITAVTGGTNREHRAMLRAFAVAEVLNWLGERHQLGIAGTVVFPASLQGGMLNPATVYRNVKKTFAAANIDVMRKGGRTLRNAYAIRELKTEAIERVGELLGHRQRRSTEYYVLQTTSDPKPDGT
ncbi:tyrosine-type recombinase/integrase [Glaciimonas sp. GNP009]